MRNLLNLLGISLFATVSLVSVGCLKKASNSAVDSAESTDPVIDPASGKKVFKVDPTTGGTLSATGISSNDPNFSKATIVIPPGALSIPVDVSLFEATPIVNPETQSALGISGATPAGPAVAILPSSNVTITGSFQISIPYSPTGLTLNTGPQYVVFGIYPTGDKFEVETFVGSELIPDSSTGVIKISIKRFGAFQVARVESQIPKIPPTETAVGFSSQKEAANGSLTYTTFYITTPSNLPKCDHTRISHLYYVLSEKEFQVCNGSSWNVVDLMPPPVTPVSDLFANAPQSSSVMIGNHKGTRTTTTYSKVPGGTPVRECHTDLWAIPTQDKNGSIVETKDSGVLCSNGGSKFVVCNQGYKPEGVGCIADKSLLDNANLFEQNAGAEPYQIDTVMGQRTTYKYFASHEPEAELVRTCYTDSWTKDIQNGVSYFSKKSGDPGCSLGGHRGTSCNNGFSFKNDACVAVCSVIHRNLCSTVTQCQDGMMGDPKNKANSGSTPTESNSSAMYWRSFYPGYWNQETSQCQSSCEPGKTPTTRGCESPATCGLEQVRTWDNACIAITWTEKQPGDLAGPIKNPTLLKSGLHTVKGDVTFEKQVKFEPGVILEFEGNFGISTFSTVYALGTAEQKIILRGKESPTADDPKARQIWKGFSFNSFDSDYTLTGTYRSGSKFSHVHIFNTLCEAGDPRYNSYASSLHGFAEHLSISCNTQSRRIDLTGYIKHSSFNVHLSSWGNSAQKPSVWQNIDVVSNNSISANNVIIIGSSFSGTSLSLGGNSVVAFSSFNNVGDIPSDAIFVGNKLSYYNYSFGSLPPQRGNEVSDNSTTEISDATAVIVMPEGISGSTQSNMLVGQVNQPFRVSALIVDKNGWVTDASVNWVTYQNNAPSEPVAGNPVTLTLGEAGIYGVSVQSILSQGVEKNQFIGRPIIATRIDAVSN